MPEVVGAFGGGEFVEELTDAIPEGVDRALGRSSEESFEFGEGELDRVQVGRVGWEIEEAGAGSLDALAHAGDFVSGEIVDDDDVAGRQARDEAAIEVGEEDIAVHRPIDDERGDEAVRAQPADKGGDLPMAVRDAADQALAAAAPATDGRHVRARPGLVDEDETARIKQGLSRDPLAARRGDVGALLLGRVHDFF